MSSANPEPVERLIGEFERMPGIGRRTAERLAFHVLKSSTDDAQRLSRAIDDVKAKVRHCSICYNLTDVEPCRLCADPRRDAAVVMVVEQPRDVVSLDASGLFKGVYHVLTGLIDPLAGVTPEDLTIPPLMERVTDAARNAQGVAVREVILGLNPTLEGDSTTLYLADRLGALGVSVSRLARGLSAGSLLDYASPAVLADAIEGRRPLSG